MKRSILAIFLGFVLLVGCYNEDDITPRQEEEQWYQLPQGNHEYDEEMVAYRDKYGFYPLYLFPVRDLYWNNAEWVEAQPSGENVSGRLGKPADTLYVGKCWEMSKQLFLDNYSDELLKEHMPFKMLFCSELWYKGYNKKTHGYDTTMQHAYTGYDYIAVNHAGASIDTMSYLTKLDFQRVVNTLFLERINSRSGLEIPEAFTKVSNYKYEYISGSSERCFELGYVKYNVLIQSNKPESIKNDFEAYLELITIPLELLEGEPGPLGTYFNDYYVSMTGVLNPKRDVNGLIRQKYEILIDYFKSIGVNTDRLQYPDLEKE